LYSETGCTNRHHHQRRRPSTALLEAHAGHAVPPGRARGEVIRVAWCYEACGAGTGKAQRPRSPGYLSEPTKFGLGCVWPNEQGKERQPRRPHATQETVKMCAAQPTSTPLHSPPTPPQHAHHPLCLTPISSFPPTCANSSSTSEEVSRECSPVGVGRKGKKPSLAADVHTLVARLRRSLLCEP
jgi:hypothetical protein